MKTKVFATLAVLMWSAVSVHAQALKPVTWKAYGIRFQAPAGYQVEDDSSEGLILSTASYYITIQLLEGEGIKRSELAQGLQEIASDDQVTERSAVTAFELPQFYGVRLQGNCEKEKCLYACLLAKDESFGFYVSIVYPAADKQAADKILKSFTLEE